MATYYVEGLGRVIHGAMCTMTLGDEQPVEVESFTLLPVIPDEALQWFDLPDWRFIEFTGNDLHWLIPAGLAKPRLIRPSIRSQQFIQYQHAADLLRVKYSIDMIPRSPYLIERGV